MKPEAAVDFETKPIGPRPYRYPPVPVGVALSGDGVPSEYFAWGHPEGNNCTAEQARRRLRDLYRTHRVIYHNAAFDIEVGTVHLGLPIPDEFECTMILAFLFDPRAEELALKPLSENLLGIAPRERDKLKDWILTHLNVKEKDWGAYISAAPGQVVAPYARGDVTRTLKLKKFFHEALISRDVKYPPDEGQQPWTQAYARELRLIPILLSMERRGIRVDVKRLERDLGDEVKRTGWYGQLRGYDKWLISRLGGEKKLARFSKKGEFNIGSSIQLADALDAAGLVSEWIMTPPSKRFPNGQRSTKRENLIQVIKDQKIVDALSKRSILGKYISTYGEKWLAMADHDGFVYPHINQVRNAEDEDRDANAGARTGRLSYSDSWQAIPNVERIPYSDLPVLRNYVIPDDGDHVILERDYSQQEFRILAHYEAGPLLARYQADPHIDMHTAALIMINELTGLGLDPKKDRRPVKDIGFGLIYGMGLAKTAKKTKQDMEVTKQLRDAYLAAIPGLKELIKSIKKRCERGEPIRTWGGRLYWVEPPAINKKTGHLQTFEYKMINVLIQGSAGDNTKEAMIRTDAALRVNSTARLMMQIHDALAASSARAHAQRNMQLMRESMESVEFDVKMLSDGKWSPKSWGAVVKYNE